MKNKYQTLLLTIALSGAMSTQAHHSFAPHFDADSPITIFGTIIEYEQRNPHAYIHIQGEDADGRIRNWRCESHGVTQLTRNGITREMLAAGNEVGISGSQHRRDPDMCFFDMVYLPDGTQLSVNGPAQKEDIHVAQRNSMFGTWMIVPARRATSGPQLMIDFLTPAGRTAVNQYDPFTDDPTYRCEPVAIRRAWFAPGTPMAITQRGQDILIQHEWMDVERLVHMNQTAAPENTPSTILGYSIGHFEGDTLIVETDHYTQGVLNQFVTVEGEPMRGLLRSDQLKTVERIHFNTTSNRLELEMEHYDPAFFTQDFPIASAEYAPSAMEIEDFGCIPEQLH